ncbi:MAG: hypothetical protein ACRYF0_01040 [Janthinobacterium lividum]
MLYTARQQGQVAQLPGFTGFAAFYSRENYYLTGRAYHAGVPSASPAWLSFSPAESPAGRKPGTGRTSLVDITCVSAIVHTSLALEAREDVVIWTCSVSGGGGSTPTGGSYPGGSYPDGSGGSYPSGSGGSGGSGGPLAGEQYDDGSGNGYGGYSPSGSNNNLTFATLAAQWDVNPLAILKPCPGLTDA